jgi:hypothetical protein
MTRQSDKRRFAGSAKQRAPGVFARSEPTNILGGLCLPPAAVIVGVIAVVITFLR